MRVFVAGAIGVTAGIAWQGWQMTHPEPHYLLGAVMLVGGILLMVPLGLVWLSTLFRPEAPSSEGKGVTPPEFTGPRAGDGGGGGTILGNGTIIHGDGGRLGAGAKGNGRAGDGGGGGFVGGDGMIMSGEGGSVDGEGIWFPPARSPLERGMAIPGLPFPTDEYGTALPGQGGMSGGYHERFQIVGRIRDEYFRKCEQEEKIKSSKIGDMPLEALNAELEKQGYPWRAEIEGRWYLFRVP